jgi:hypothetical protein
VLNAEARGKAACSAGSYDLSKRGSTSPRRLYDDKSRTTEARLQEVRLRPHKQNASQRLLPGKIDVQAGLLSLGMQLLLEAILVAPAWKESAAQ